MNTMVRGLHSERMESARTVYPPLHNKVLALRNALWARTGAKRAFAPTSVEVVRDASGRSESRLDDRQLAELVGQFPPGTLLRVRNYGAADRRSLEALLIAAERHDIQAAVDANGADLEDAAPVLYGLGVAAVRFRLFGDEEIQNAVAGCRDAFERTARGALMLKGLSSGAQDPKLVVEVPISAANQAMLPETVECGLAMGADEVVLAHNLGSGNGADHSADIDPQLVNTSISAVTSRRRRTTVSVFPDLTEREVVALYTEGCGAVGPSRCLAPWRSAMIDLGGNVRLCGATVGRWPDEPLLRIYNGPEARRLRKAIRRQTWKQCGSCPGRFGGDMAP